MSRSLRVVLIAVALFAASCGGGDDTSAENPDPDEGTTTTATPTTAEPADGDDPPTTTAGDADPVPLTASFRGVTETEIKIGVVIIDVETIGRSNGDVEGQWNAVIDDVNANGGVLGRNLVPVFARYSPLGDVESEAACVKHTQDEEVFAGVGPLRSSVLCYTEVNDTIFVNTFGVGQEQYDRSSAVLIGPGALPARNSEINVAALQAEGLLDGTVALHGAVGATDERDIWSGALTDAGVDLVSQTQSTVENDVVANEAEMRSFAQVWASDGADIVIGVGAGSGLNVIAGLDGGNYEPAVIVTNGSDLDPELYRNLGYSTEKLAGAHALGFETFQDLATRGAPDVAACIARAEAATGETTNIDPADGEAINLNTTIWSCQAIEIFAQIAAAAGAELTNDSFRAAAESFGELEVTAMSASVGAGKFDIGDDSPLILVFDAAADDFVAV
jgi:hypothetical protein